MWSYLVTFSRDPDVPRAPHDSEEGRKLILNGLLLSAAHLSSAARQSLDPTRENRDGVEVNWSPHSF